MKVLIPVLLSFILGIFSMGFQLLGSRMLNPWFGSSIIVWAFIISIFLAAFSTGSLLGGFLVRLAGPARFRALCAVTAAAVLGFGFNALFSGHILAGIDAWAPSLPLALGVACVTLFFVPVCALSSLTPVLIQRVSESGQKAGYASGLVYCISTLGNIAGIMLTAFFLIPAMPLSSLLLVWTSGIALLSLILLRCLRA